MKTLLSTIALVAMMATPALASHEGRNFMCEGQTYHGEFLTVSGRFDGNQMVEDVYVFRNGQYLYYWDAPNVNISGTRTFWTVTGMEGQNTLVIRHPERVSNQTYMRIVVPHGGADNEFTKATCTFWD
jgi:hypothetical protein